VRDVARDPDIGFVFVMTGPLYERAMDPLPNADEPHSVPSGYWKIVVTEVDDVVSAVAFALDQDTPRSADFCDFQVGVAELENRSSLIFFGNMSAVGKMALGSDTARLVSSLGCDP